MEKINSSYFSVLVDKTTDIACVEQISSCICYIDSTISNIEEPFLQFLPLEAVICNGIAVVIIDKLKALGIDLSKLHG